MKESVKIEGITRYAKVNAALMVGMSKGVKKGLSRC